MSERPAKRRRVELSLDDKVKIINKYETLPKPTLRLYLDNVNSKKKKIFKAVSKKPQ